MHEQVAKDRQKEADEKRRAAAEAVAKQIAAAAAQQREEDEKRRSTAQIELERVLAQQKAAMLKNEAQAQQNLGRPVVAAQQNEQNDRGEVARDPPQDQQPIIHAQEQEPTILQTAIEANSQKPTELKPLVSASIGQDVPTEISHPLTAVERLDHVKRVQAMLKSHNCYRGEINGDLDDTAEALKRLETSYDGNVRHINLASATISDYENWLGWYEGLDKFSCPAVEQPKKQEEAPKKIQKAHEQPVETEKETARRANREARSVDRESRPAREPREQRSVPAAPSHGAGAMTGVGF